MPAAAPNRTKVHGQRRIRQATGALVGAGLMLTGGVAVLINAGLGDSASASSDTSTVQTSSNSSASSGDLQVNPGSGDSHADSSGS